MPSRYLTPHRSNLHWKVAFNTANDFETSRFSHWVRHDPEFSTDVCHLHKLLLDQGLEWEACRIQLATGRVAHGESFPPDGPPLLLGDDPPIKAVPPFNSRDVEIVEFSEDGEHYYEMRRRGGAWCRRTAEQLWPRGKQPPVSHPASPRSLTASASAPATVSGGTSQLAPAPAAAASAMTASSRARMSARLRALALGRDNDTGGGGSGSDGGGGQVSTRDRDRGRDSCRIS